MISSADFLAIGAVFGVVLLSALPTKLKRSAYGILLFTLGIIPILATYGVIASEMHLTSIYRFLGFFVVVIVGKTLFAEAIKEQNMMLKISSMILGAVIVLVTTIPTMAHWGVIEFTLPEYSILVNSSLYVAAGIVTILGAFKAGEY